MMALGASETSDRVLRGGSWANDADNLRASYRNWNHAWNRNQNYGFRCCLCRVSPSSEHALTLTRPCRKRPGQPDGLIGRPNRHCLTVPVSLVPTVRSGLSRFGPP